MSSPPPLYTRIRENILVFSANSNAIQLLHLNGTLVNQNEII